MKKNGYTLIELLIVVVVLGVVSFLTINKVSHSLVDNTDEIYKEDIYSILESAKVYGEANKETLMESSSMVITVQDLIDNDYVGCDDNGNYIYVRSDGATLNDLKIVISYDKENDKINSELAN